jgi:hypothetical protein
MKKILDEMVREGKLVGNMLWGFPRYRKEHLALTVKL